MQFQLLCLLLAALLQTSVVAFLALPHSRLLSGLSAAQRRSSVLYSTTPPAAAPSPDSSKTSTTTNDDGKKIVTCKISLGAGYQDIDVQFRPLFAQSEFVVVTYAVPFGLNVEKPPKNFPAPIVTKDGAGGEKTGDVLRATTCFSQGFQAAGAASDIAAFAGNIKWRRSVFDTTGAQWEQTVQALVSNTAERTDSVTLVFEREIE